MSTPSDVRTYQLTDDDPLPLVVEPAGPVDLAGWISRNRHEVERLLLRHGAILFRDFGVDGVSAFHAVATAVHPTLVEYSEPSTPRGEYQDRVYVSSEYPPDYSIPLHCELSYTYQWPMKALFYCRRAAAVGGETPVADARTVLRRIAPEVRQRFRDRQVMYVRNYENGLLVPWRTAFRTDSRAEVERHCQDNQPMTCEWLPDEHLRTRQVRPAVAVHPATGDEVWFNQAHVFHTYSLGAQTHEELTDIFGTEGKPVHAFYGDGTEITTDDLDAVYRAYDESKRFFSWREGDVLLADNMTVSHGRHPFEGEREVVVAFVEPCPPIEVRGGVFVPAGAATPA
jgi:alpha-ketoglutarate-dependent taurine dioxygenase